MDNLSQFEADLWAAADNLRANSKLTSSDYFMPVLGIIFLRHAENRFNAATQQIAEDQASGRMPKRQILPADYIRRRALFLPEEARFDTIMAKAKTDQAGLPTLVTNAMNAIEADFEPLLNVLPKDYGIFEPDVLESLMRLFNSEQIKRATGDIFGRIYEYFLAKFSIQKAHDNGEFFTPSSLVQLIVNVIEPDHGTVLDPACGSGGMFVQTSHFIEHEGGDTTKKVVFYGQEKNRDTIRIAKMNLAVHGLEGKIKEAITYYQDEHNLGPMEALEPGSCDFVMANPPFNVDLVDAEKIKTDARLPFGLPGVNKDKRVSNGNYLWISYFYSYLNEKGRAGFVMSSQASSAGNDEKTVRQKLVETGAVDVMISIKSGFFYTRTVPCELWHFDRAKPTERQDQVLMLDARSIGQLMKGSRKVYEFTPEQMRNLTAIVWLYRGQQDRFLALVHDYFKSHIAACATLPEKITSFELALANIDAPFGAVGKTLLTTVGLDAEKVQAFTDTLAELQNARTAFDSDAKALITELSVFEDKIEKNPPATNDQQQLARNTFDPIAAQTKGLIKQVDLIYKLASRAATNAVDLTEAEAVAKAYNRRTTGKLIKQLDETRRTTVEQLKYATYFHRQIVWLQDRFPQAEIHPVPGLVKVVTRKEIESADWSLTPGRYVGVASSEVDEDFDFEQAITEIHEELAGLNTEATELAAKIQANLEDLTL